MVRVCKGWGFAPSATERETVSNKKYKSEINRMWWSEANFKREPKTYQEI